MLPDQVSNPGPLTYESGALPIVLRGTAMIEESTLRYQCSKYLEMAVPVLKV